MNENNSVKENPLKNEFSMLMKFGKRCNLEKLQQGKVYMKNLQYYIDLENSTNDENVGDKYDSLMPLNDVKITMLEIDSGDLIARFQCPVATMDLGFSKCPVFCMFMFDYRNHTSERLSGDELTVRYDFSDEQRAKLKGFGDSVLLIENGNEFATRMKKGFLSNGISFSRDFVSYYDGNIIQHIQDVQKDDKRIVFWKRQKYSYQNEYRFVAFNSEVDEHLCIDIGDISDITRLEATETILNTYIEIAYKVTLKK